MFLAPLSHLMHPRSAALHSPSMGEAPALFSAPYPMVQPPATMAAIVHSPNPRPIAGVHPTTSTVDDITRREAEYIHMFHLTPQPAQTLFIPHGPPPNRHHRERCLPC